MVQSLRNESNINLTITVVHLEPRRWPLTVLLTHLLATESFFDAAALGHSEAEGRLPWPAASRQPGRAR